MESKQIEIVVKGVTKKWKKQKKAEMRNMNRQLRRADAFRSLRTTIKNVAWQVMEQSYLKASSSGKYPAHARQIMYAARPAILDQADTETLDDRYFTQTLLPDYIAEHPNQTQDWDVIFDARGMLHEPHTGEKIEMGTIGVRNYLNSMHTDMGAIKLHSTDITTLGPDNRYGGILFLEKEGFMPILEAANIAARYDLAVVSTKGMPSTAARMLIDQLCSAGSGIRLFVLHDFDKSGFSILGTLYKNTRRYTYAGSVNVVDLGIRLEDIEQWNLDSEPYHLGKSDPSLNLRENGATEDEINWMITQRGYDSYHGRRVELNAFTSGNLVRWIEHKLQENGVEKVIPDAGVIESAYRRMLLVSKVNKTIESVIKEEATKAEQISLDAESLIGQVKDMLAQQGELSWDRALALLAKKNLKYS